MLILDVWMVVLIAEAVGVGSGLGQVTMMARNTFNASLVFFTMTLIGLTGFLFDQTLGHLSNHQTSVSLNKFAK